MNHKINLTYLAILCENVFENKKNSIASMPPKSSTALKTEIERYIEIPSPEESHVRLSPKAREMREQVEDLLDGRFLDMYHLSRETHERFGLVGENQKFPSAIETASAFNPEDFALASRYQEPALVLCPPRKTYEDLLSNISARSNVAVRNGPRILDLDELDFDSGVEYRAFIAEAASEMLPNDDLPGKPLLDRIDHKVNRRRSEEWGMSPDLHALLAMQSIVRGQMIDRQTFTIQDGEPIVAGHYIPVGHCRKRKPTIEWFQSNVNVALSRRGRFRRVLGGRSIIDLE